MKYLGKKSVSSVLRTILTVMWVFGIAMIIIFVGLAIFFIIYGPPKGMHSPQFSLDTDFLKIEFPGATIKHPKLLFISFLPFGMLMVAFGMAIIYELRKIFVTLVAGNPFLLENAKRIRRIAIFIFSGVFVELIAGNALGKIIMKNVVVEGVSFSVKGDLNMGGVFLGFVILILAEIFRQGALLKEEQDLTI